MHRHPSLRLAALILAVLAAACGEPPNREINEAKGALDAARAAGAEQYAAEALNDAQTAYDKSLAAVEQRDYRLALNHALDARERAHDAVKDAGNEKSRVRADVARTLQSAEDSLRMLNTRISTAETAKTTSAQLAAARRVVEPLEAAVSRAREAVAKGDFMGARTTLEKIEERVAEATSEIDAVLASRGPRRRAGR
jgi:hypothetical protein